jgi:hypothetical protein
VGARLGGIFDSAAGFLISTVIAILLVGVEAYYCALWTIGPVVSTNWVGGHI